MRGHTSTVESGLELARVPGGAAAFSGDGERLWTGTRGGDLLSWDISLESRDAAAIARAIAARHAWLHADSGRFGPL